MSASSSRENKTDFRFQNQTHLPRIKWLGVLPFALVILLLIIVQRDAQNFPNLPLFIAVLNTIFIFISSLIISYLLARNYLNKGQPLFLWLSSGISILAFGGLVTWLPNDNAKLTIAFIFNLLAGFTVVISIAFARGGSDITAKARRYAWLPVLYGGGLLLMILVYILAHNGVIPPFFNSQTGNTMLKQATNFASGGLFAVGGAYFMSQFFKSRRSFFYWFSLGLLLAGLALFVVGFSFSLYSIFNWIPRSALYLCGIYWLIAAISVLREARTRHIPVAETIAEFFRHTRENYQRKAEEMPLRPRVI